MGLVGRGGDVLTTAKLHRRVGLLISVAAATVLVANLWTAPPYAQDWPKWRLILAPQVSLVGLISIFSAVAAFFPRLRVVDVAIVVAVGVGATISDDRANLTGLILFVVGAVVAFEYGYYTKHVGLKLAFSALLYLASLLAGLIVHELFTGWTLVRSLGVTVFVVGTLSIVAVKRAREINRRHELLEEKVAEQTKELSTALADQKVLLMEIHHRTKNNLQLVSSLLSLETDSLLDDREQTIEDMQSRIRALGRAHELLYAATPSEKTDLADFLSNYFLEMEGIADIRGLTILPEIRADAHVQLDFSIRLAVMLNELVLNAMGHAATAGRTNVMRLSIRTDRGVLTIDASETDLPEEAPPGGRTEIGATILESLVDTLHGSVVQDQSGRRSLRIQLPLP